MNNGKNKKLLVTGGLGFIGSNFIRTAVYEHYFDVVNIDMMSAVSSDLSAAEFSGLENYTWLKFDISKADHWHDIFKSVQPDVVIHFAAESHVDRSISSAAPFIESNILGTFNLLERATEYFLHSKLENAQQFRVIHVSTDEVFGSLGSEGCFDETSAYKPNSPYSASKAASDHLVRAWHKTYGLPTIITNCSNNFGPFQNAEKLIPKIIQNCLASRDIPVYGDGKNVRDWIFVDDHVSALFGLIDKGLPGENYNIGADNEVTNIEMVMKICKLMEGKLKLRQGQLADLVKFVTDRKGHDFRYAVDSTKIRNATGWTPSTSLDQGLNATIDWYLMNQAKLGWQK